MSILESGFVRLVADALGIKPSEEAIKTMAPDVEYRLREVIQDAMKIARHAHRTCLSPEDINSAFRLRNTEPIYGLTSFCDRSHFIRASGHNDLLYVNDPILPLSSLLLDSKLPPVPWEAGASIHWLAVEGKQPSIPENIPLLPPDYRMKRRRAAMESTPLPLPEAVPKQVEETAGKGIASPTKMQVEETSDRVLLRAPVQHVVPKELHMYFEKVEGILLNAPLGSAAYSAQVLAVLSSLQADAGLQPLLPYLCHFLGTSIGSNIGDPDRLILLLRAIGCLALNINLDLGPYLHEMVPAVLICLLTASIRPEEEEDEDGSEKSAKDGNPIEDDCLPPDAQHWKVRDEASRTLAHICSAYIAAAPRIQRQIVETLAIGRENLSLSTMYGAIVGLADQGPRVVRLLLLPNLIPVIGSIIFISRRKISGYSKKASALKVFDALLRATADCVFRSSTVVEKKVFPVTLDQIGICSIINQKQTRDIDTGKSHGHVSSQRTPTSQTSDRTHPGPLTLLEAFDYEDGADEFPEPAARWIETVDKLIKLKPMEPIVNNEESSQLFFELGENLASLQALYDLDGSWREDYPVDRIVIAMEDIFGCQLEPYTVYNPVFV